MTRLPTEFQDLGDIRIAYCQSGTGQDLLLLHGNSESKAIFSAYQQNHFSMFHTYALDSRGHGDSISSDERLTIDQISEDVIRFCQAKGMKEVYVIGYSDGGNIALLLAKKAPELFTRIIAISPNYLVSGTEDGTLRMIKGAYQLMTFLNRLGIRMKKQMMRFMLMLEDIGISDKELAHISTRVKILYAGKDMIKEDHILQIARLIPGSSLNKITDCTHMTIIKKQDAINIMKDFLLEQEKL